MLKGVRIVLGLGLLLAACWVSAYLAEWWPLTQFIVSPAYVFGLRALCVSLLVLLAGSCWGVLFQRAYGRVWLVLLGFVRLMVLYVGLPLFASAGYVAQGAAAAMLQALLAFVADSQLLLYVAAFFTGLSLASERVMMAKD